MRRLIENLSVWHHSRTYGDVPKMSHCARAYWLNQKTKIRILDALCFPVERDHCRRSFERCFPDK